MNTQPSLALPASSATVSALLNAYFPILTQQTSTPSQPAPPASSQK